MNLDELLSQPLQPVPDNGFSARVMARIKTEERRHVAMTVALSVAATIVLCVMMPLRDLTGLIGGAIIELGTSPMILVAVIVLALTFLVDRLYTDHKLLQI